MKYMYSLYMYVQHTGACAGAVECVCVCVCVCVCEEEWPVFECGRDDRVRVCSREVGDSELNHLEFRLWNRAPTPELRDLP